MKSTIFSKCFQIALIALLFAITAFIVPTYSSGAENVNTGADIPEAINTDEQPDVFKRIFFDDDGVTATISSWRVARESVIDTSFKKEGEASLKIQYQPNSDQSTSAFFLNPNLSITPELRENGILQFWYYSESDIPALSVTLVNSDVDGSSVESRVDIKKGYLFYSDLGKWTLIQIPLTAFSPIGQVWNGRGFDDAEFDFSNIDRIYFYGHTKGVTTMKPVYIDSLCITDKKEIIKKVLKPTAYYVSPNGSDANDGLTPETPFKTPQKAANITNPGDTVYFMGGTYESRSGSILSIKRSGKEDAYITYTNYKNEKPVFKAGDNVWDTVAITSSYIIIDGLTLVGINDELTVEEGFESYYAVLKQQDTGVPFNNGAVARTNTNGISVNGRPATANGTENPHHIIVRNCDVSMFPAGGICTLDADYIIIENNVVHDNMYYSLYGASGISLNGNVDVDDNTTEYKNIIRNNIVYNNKSYVMCQNGRKWSDSNGIIIDYFKNTYQANKVPYKGKTLVCNNVCYQNGGSGILVFNSENVDIINNTSVDNGQTPELTDWGNIAVNWASNVRVINNIAVSTRNNTLTLEYGTQNLNVQFKNNIHFNTLLPSSNKALTMSDIPYEQIKHNIWADPEFVDLEGKDFRLRETSPAVDAGMKTLAPDTDLEGNARPQGVNYDMGAYESSHISSNPAVE